MSARQNRRRAWGRVKAQSDGRLWTTGPATTQERAVRLVTERKSHGATLTPSERWTLAESRNPLESARRAVLWTEAQEEHGREIESRNARQSSLATRVKHIARPYMQTGTFGKNDSPIPFEGN